MSPSKPTCPVGYHLLESVTQTSSNGGTNEWFVAHVVYNDTTNETMYSARTPMGRSQAGKAHTLNLDAWCVRPGNYSLNLWDYSGLTGANLGWKGGGVFLSDADDCQIVHATAEGVSNATYYFTVSAAGDDATTARCSNGTAAVRNKTEGWCTYAVTEALAATCNALEVRLPVTASSTADHTNCNTVRGFGQQCFFFVFALSLLLLSVSFLRRVR